MVDGRCSFRLHGFQRAPDDVVLLSELLGKRHYPDAANRTRARLWGFGPHPGGLPGTLFAKVEADGVRLPLQALRGKRDVATAVVLT